MCVSCVAQGVTYVGGAVVGLQVMAARARRRREGAVGADTSLPPSPAVGVEAGQTSEAPVQAR